jgi:hypothetical protein
MIAIVRTRGSATQAHQLFLTVCKEVLVRSVPHPLPTMECARNGGEYHCRLTTLFLIKAPRTIPVCCRRIPLHTLEPTQKRMRRSVARDDFERCSKGAVCLGPPTRAKCRKSFGIASSQQVLARRKFALSPHDLKHDVWLRLPKYRQTIDFAHFNCGAHCTDGCPRNQ